MENRNIREKEYIYCPTYKNKLFRKKIDKRELLACPNCNFVFWNSPQPSVSGLFVKQRKNNG